MIVGLQGVVEDFSAIPTFEEAGITALAAITATEATAITFEYQQTYPSLVHVTMRFKTGALNDQRVTQNLTTIFLTPDHVTVFFTALSNELPALAAVEQCQAAHEAGINPCYGPDAVPAEDGTAPVPAATMAEPIVKCEEIAVPPVAMCFPEVAGLPLQQAIPRQC